ncbi:hypothetical protein [Streptococcus thoraltensis]|uniref:hypothetical protein n=1 Tax=Streptococcus thoraltensis TaxID=55085 RepID=UPI001F5A0D8C|nr:hypothetical protein [Streptococcus thoraltensis]
MNKRYYENEFNRICDRYCFNLRLFGSDKKLRESCYREALNAIEKVKAKAIVNQDIDTIIARMALNTIRVVEDLYGVVG